MAGLIKKFVIGTSVAAGMTALTGVSALAASLSGVSVSGQHITYCSNGTTTYSCANNSPNWGAALSGDGNIELAGQSLNALASGFGTASLSYSDQSSTTLIGTLDSTTIKFNSLTYSDWFGGPIDGYSSFAKKWLTEAWNDTSTGIQNFFVNQGAADVNAALTAIQLIPYEGVENWLLRRASDANIAYVNNDGGTFNVGLAGHLDHPSGFKFSEVVKVTIGEGEDAVTQFLYGFGQADASGVYEEGDGSSHNGIYRFQDGKQIIDVPEPSTLLGLMAVGGALAIAKGKKSDGDA